MQAVLWQRRDKGRNPSALPPHSVQPVSVPCANCCCFSFSFFFFCFSSLPVEFGRNATKASCFHVALWVSCSHWKRPSGGPFSANVTQPTRKLSRACVWCVTSVCMDVFQAAWVRKEKKIQSKTLWLTQNDWLSVAADTPDLWLRHVLQIASARSRRHPLQHPSAEHASLLQDPSI